MAQAPRRTPEQIAAEHQRKANVARAKARKLAKQRETDELIALGKLAKEQGLDAGANDPYAILGRAVVKSALGTLHAGERKHLNVLRHLFSADCPPDDWKAFEEFWASNSWPTG